MSVEPHLSVTRFSVEFVPRYIKTSGNATVDHLSKYLAVRLALEELRKNGDASPINVEAASEKQYTIYIPTTSSQFTVRSPGGPVFQTEWGGSSRRKLLG